MLAKPNSGPALRYEVWRALADRLEAAGTDWVIPPTVRFTGDPGEQSTTFRRALSGNSMEVKGFRGMSQVFAS